MNASKLLLPRSILKPVLYNESVLYVHQQMLDVSHLALLELSGWDPRVYKHKTMKQECFYDKDWLSLDVMYLVLGSLDILYFFVTSLSARI